MRNPIAGVTPQSGKFAAWASCSGALTLAPGARVMAVGVPAVRFAGAPSCCPSGRARGGGGTGGRRDRRRGGTGRRGGGRRRAATRPEGGGQTCGGQHRAYRTNR